MSIIKDQITTEELPTEAEEFEGFMDQSILSLKKRKKQYDELRGPLEPHGHEKRYLRSLKVEAWFERVWRPSRDSHDAYDRVTEAYDAYLVKEKNNPPVPLPDLEGASLRLVELAFAAKRYDRALDVIWRDIRESYTFDILYIDRPEVDPDESDINSHARLCVKGDTLTLTLTPRHRSVLALACCHREDDPCDEIRQSAWDLYNILIGGYADNDKALITKEDVKAVYS